MRVAAGVLVSVIALGVLGSADARAPDLRDGGAIQGMQGLMPAVTQTHTSPTHASPAVSAGHDAQPDTTSSRDAAADHRESAPDLWLLAGVCFGLVVYQLRRKHRQLRPQPFILQTDI